MSADDLSSIDEDDTFPLDTALPLTLLLGNVDHEGVLSSLSASKRQYKKKVLESLPKNWESIVAYFDEFSVSCVLVKLTPHTFRLLAHNDYKLVRERLFSRIATVPNIVFIFEDLLTGQQQDKWKEEYRPYPSSELIEEVLTWMESFEIELIPYRKNAEVTVLAESFLDDTEKNLILRLYVPSGRIWAAEADRLFQLFRDYLGRVEHLSVRLDQRRTEQGVIYEFHGETAKEQSELNNEFDEFLRLMEFCSSNTGAAEALLVSKSINSRDVADIVSRYSKEAKRLQVDLKQERERKLLGIRHRLESELVDVNTTAVDWAEIAQIVDATIPSVTGASSVLLHNASGLPKELLGGNVTINVRPQIVQSVNAIVAQEIYGNQYLTQEDHQLLQLISEHGGAKAKELESSVHELADKSVPHADRLGAKQKLKKFLIEVGKKSADVAFGVLQTYIEKQIGL